MSSSWDSSPYQVQGAGGAPAQQQVGDVKLFDPTQFQAPHQQQPQPTSQGNAIPAQNYTHQQQPGSASYFNPDLQQGQGSWDNWGSWNWNTEGQNIPVSGQGEGAPLAPGQSVSANEQHPGQVGSQKHEQSADQQHPQNVFYTPQQYHNGSAAPNASVGAPGTQTAEYNPQWNWNPEQQQYVPADSTGIQQQPAAAGQDMNSQGHYFYQGQQPQQAFYDPSAWNSANPAHTHQWGGHIPAQPQQQTVGQDAGQCPPQDGGVSVSGHAHMEISANNPQSNFGGETGYHNSTVGGITAPPSVDVSSHRQDPALSHGNIGQNHTRQSSVDSNTSGTVARFYGHDDDKPQEMPPQPQVSTPATDPASMQFLNVNTFQRTDSGISNTSLQTVNLSADEEVKDRVEVMTGQMGSMQLGQESQSNQVQSSQHYAHPGDFSGFGNYGQAPPEPRVGQEGALSSGSGDSDQSPMMNDWEIVPPQGHSSALHSRNNSLEDGSSTVPKSQESEKVNAVSQPLDTQSQTVPPQPVKETQSSTTQDSESFTAISSASSGEAQSSVPFSQGSGYYPTASSTPLTSPGAQSVLSQPSSLPSLQNSPQQAAAGSSSASVLPVQRGQPNQPNTVQSASNHQNSPDKTGDVSQQSKESGRSLYNSAVSNRSGDSSGRTPEKTGVEPERPRAPDGRQGKESGHLSSPSRRHQSAFHPVHSQRAQHNMSPATSLWDNLDSTPTGNILLAPAAPLIIPSLGTNQTQTSANTSTASTSAATSSTAQPALHKSSSNSSSLEKLAGREGGRKSREREGRYGAGRRGTDRGSMNKSEELSRSRDDDNRSLGSLDELDATPDFTDDSMYRNDRSRGYGRDPRDPRDVRDPRYDPYYDRPSSRSDGYRDDYRGRPRDPYRDYGYRDPYYDERYDRPRSRQDEERLSRPSSRSARDMDRPRSRAEYERERDPQRGAYRERGYPGYDGYGPHDYYYDDRERFYRYYRDSRYRHGYAEEMGQYYGQQQQQQYDSRYAGYYGHPPPPRYPPEEFDRSSIGSQSRGQTPLFDDSDPSTQDYYGRSSRPSSRTERDRDAYPAPGYGSGYGSGYDGYGGYYDHYQYQYPYYNYQHYGEQQQGGYQQGRMTPPKYLLPHVRVCFGPTGQLVTVLPTRPAEGQPATVEIHDVQAMLQEQPEVEELKAFPGPLIRNETHKNDVLVYCQTKAKECADNVDMLDRDSAELIWRLLELLLKQNGTIIGTDIADLLLAGHEPLTHEYSVSGVRSAQSHSSEVPGTPDREGESGASSPAVRVTTDRTVISAAQQLEESTDRFRSLLLYGRKKEALDWAMKRNLWGHALFLASKMDNRTHASVMTRFANTAMRMNDPLQTLYQLMSGRQPASVTNVVDERWGDWRPHLAMILSNHSSRPDLDKKSIIALGDTLATKHCLHASHFCYLMAQVDFGSFFKKTSKLVLIGSNHTLPLEEFYNNGAIQCTEVYEYAQTLGNNRFSLTQFQVYKFLYTCRLAEYGLAQEAFHYCEVIASQVLLSPGRYHPAFISILYSLSSKLKHSDPQKLHEGHDSADPPWLTQLYTVCQGYEEGSIQFKSGSATPMTGYGGMTPSSESGEMAGYAMDSSSVGGVGGAFPQDSSSYISNSSYSQQQTAATTTTQFAPQGEVATQQAYTGVDQYGQYSQQASADQQYNWQQQQQQQQQQQTGVHQHQQYDASQYQQQQQQQWQGYEYSQGYGTDQAIPAQSTEAYTPAGPQQGTEQPAQHLQQYHQQQQQQQQQQQLSSSQNSYNSYNPQQMSHQGVAADQALGGDDDDDDDEDDDEEDDMDGEAVAGGSNFDYFGAASQQKIVAPPSRYRTTSTSSAGSVGHRRRRTTSGSSTGSVRAANKPAAASAKPADTKPKAASSQKSGGGSWLGGFFSKFGRGKNEMKLPDDKNPSIIWDSEKKMWINKDGDGDEGTVAAPPPTDSDLMGKMKAPSAPIAGPASSINGPPTTNRFSMQRGRGARGQYVDVLNPGGGGGGGGGSSGSTPVPPGLFNVMPGTDANSSATGSAPQLFNPSGAPSGSSSQSDLPSTQGAPNTLAPPSQDLSRSSSLSSLSREIQQLTMKAQELGDGGPPSASTTGPAASQPAPSLPMMFNPSQLSQSSSSTQPSAGNSGMKYGQRRVYPK